MSFRCLLVHDYQKRLELTPIWQDTGHHRESLIRVVQRRICTRCSKEKVSEEIVPFRFVVEDDEE